MIVVTTPTGSIGHQVLAHLLAGAEPLRVVARDPSRIPAATRERVEVVEGSHGDAAAVDRAFSGADAVFWLPPPDPRADSIEAAYVDFSRPACAAFRRHGVKHVVGVSSFGRGRLQAKNAGHITASLAMDDMIGASGVSYRALAMPSFMDNTLRQVATIKAQGVFFSPVPADLKTATCSTRDIAAVGARLLIDRSWSGTGEVPVLGPEDLSANDMARIMSEVLGKPVRCQAVSFEAVKAGLLARGLSDAMAQATVDLMAAVKDGIYSDAPRDPGTDTPTSFHQWCAQVLKPAVLAD